MSEKFIRAEEVSEVMEISVPYAYKIIRNLNQELSDRGFITVTGRVNRAYFNERIYNTSPKKGEYTYRTISGLNYKVV